MSCDYSFLLRIVSFFFFFNDTATTEIYTLSLHDALPIYHFVGGSGIPIHPSDLEVVSLRREDFHGDGVTLACLKDRKSTRLNSSHSQISYAVFCLKKKKNSTDA